MPTMPTDVAGGVTDEDIEKLFDALKWHHVGKDEAWHRAHSRELVRRFALDQQARGVMRAEHILEAPMVFSERQKALRALAERIRKGQL